MWKLPKNKLAKIDFNDLTALSKDEFIKKYNICGFEYDQLLDEETTRKELIELSNKPFSVDTFRLGEEVEIYTREQKEEIKKLGLNAFIEKEQFNRLFGVAA